jgi:ATP synthase protein I
MAESEIENAFVPLSKAQADRLRPHLTVLAPWQVLLGQVLLGCFMTAVAYFAANPAAAFSLAYGAFAVVGPGILFAIGIKKVTYAASPGASVLGFFLWEMIKVFASISLLVAAPILINNLSWLGLFVGLIVTLKVYLFAGLLQRSKSTKN